jgi:hypothetical protein
VRNKHKIVVGIHDGKKSLGRSRHIWKNNIKMNLAERMRAEVHSL